LAIALLSGAGTILPDEPTNQLDLTSILVMERALAHFPGAVFVVSHDRLFIEKIANRRLVSEGVVTCVGSTAIGLPGRQEEWNLWASRKFIVPLKLIV